MLSGARTRCEEAPGEQMRQIQSVRTCMRLTTIWSTVYGLDRDWIFPLWSANRVLKIYNSMIQIWNIIWKAHDFEYTIYLNGIESELPLTAQKVSLSPSPKQTVKPPIRAGDFSTAPI